jgi:hypothetical protein
MTDTTGFLFPYTPRFELKSESVKTADNLRVEASKALNRVWGQTFDKYSSNETVRVCRGLIREAKIAYQKAQGTPLSSFDAVVLDDIGSNLYQAEAIMRRFFYEDPKEDKINSLDFLNRMFTKQGLRIILDTLKPRSSSRPYGFPHRELEHLSKLEEELESRLLDSESAFMPGIGEAEEKRKAKIRERFSQGMVQARNDAQDSLTSLGMIEGFGSFRLDYLPDGYGAVAFYDAGLKTCSVSPGVLSVRQRKEGLEEEIDVNRTWAQLVTAHEISHMLQEILSGECIQARGPGDFHNNYVNLIHGQVGEGVAQVVERFSLAETAKSRSRRGIDSLDFAAAALKTRTHIWKSAGQMAYNVLRSLNIEEEKAAERVSQIAKNPFYWIGSDKLIESDMLEVINDQLIYLFGLIEVEATSNDLQSRGVPNDMILSALHTGTWASPLTQRKFVNDVWMPAVKSSQPTAGRVISLARDHDAGRAIAAKNP